jgi:hypothetical protein
MSNETWIFGKRIYMFLVCFRNEDNGEINDFFSFDWNENFLTERKLRLKTGNEVSFLVGLSKLV